MEYQRLSVKKHSYKIRTKAERSFYLSSVRDSKVNPTSSALYQSAQALIPIKIPFGYKNLKIVVATSLN